jgi:hypothetical protein
MDGAGSAQRQAASKLGPGQPEDVAQYPEQRRVTVDIDYVIRSIDMDCVGHDYPRDFPTLLGGKYRVPTTKLRLTPL